MDIKEKEEKEPMITLTLGYVSNRSWNWDGFCDEVGLNPWCMNEGLADKDTEISVKLSVAKKFGLI